MLTAATLQGVYTPVVTPFTTSGELDLRSYRRYVERLVEQGIHGIVVAGTTGESPTLAWEEVERLYSATVEVLDALGRRIPVVVGTGTNDTIGTVRRTEQALKLGADAALVVVPYYSRPSAAGIVEHFRLAAETGLPVIAYDIPYRTGVSLSVDTLRNILAIPGVIGLKDSSGGLSNVIELSRTESKPILCGEDFYFFAALCVGASGGMLASSSVRTERFVEMFAQVRSGQAIEAKAVFDELVPLIRLLFQEPNPAPLKWLLARQGMLDSGSLRLPMTEITESLRQELRAYV
ncbi:4-hydroxy-tetrahydrodipicolinate synthase [Paenibacillus koleovorans]|uniref:4-hydroxy-tetrahydrodipicolinate synthase n=1 Tax=Paenibacillus koleovorans TaxID=121608 RepID=UPI000FDAA29F|nr:4-hydroxy-tetrahydrodipicolinate synthase [Paenibacillus koleovorans]